MVHKAVAGVPIPIALHQIAVGLVVVGEGDCASAVRQLAH